MNLRQKTLWIILSLSAALILIVIVIARLINAGSFQALEARLLREDINRSVSTLNSQINSLAVGAFDYARWDDTYAFAQGENPTYDEEYLTPIVYEDFRLDAIFVLDNAGAAVYAGAFDDGVIVDPDPALTDFVSGSAALTSHADPESRVSGLIMTPYGPAAVASMPILPNAGAGAVQGAFIWLRFLGPDEETNLTTGDYAVELLPVDTQTNPAQSPDAPVLDEAVRIDRLSSDRIAGEVTLADLQGAPVMALRVIMDRDVAQQGDAAYLLLVVTLVIVGVSLAAAGALIMDQLVTNRLSKLQQTVTQITADGDFTRRTQATGHDEIGQLSTSINTMLDRLVNAQSALEASETRLEAVLMRAPLLLMIVKMDGSIALMTGRSLSVLGITGDIPTGASAFDAFADNLELLRDIRRGLKGETLNRVTPFDSRVFDMYYTPIRNEGGTLNGLICVGVDATERYENEQALREARDAAETANEAKTTFLANMSHELRTPLNAIIGFTGIMLMGNQLGEKDLYRAQRIRANGERLLSIIDDILDLSRIEAGRLVLVPQEIKLRRLVNDVDAHLRPQAEDKGLGFSVTVDDSLPEMVHADHDALFKIMNNLISNGIKFTETGTVDMRLERKDDKLVIAVRDTGIGIPSHMHETIFESFRQVDGSSTRRYGGTGLGLAIVHHLCQGMSGKIQLESTVGEGSTFTILLPLLEEDSHAPSYTSG
ncbi:MAG: ATP-binding protein [Chloroflexota bacterium]